jgi:predicted RNase H-like HicB family nuclease
MRIDDLRLRCYAERDRDGSWFAMCIDLNLYARADSLRDAKRELSVIITEYVREALTVDKKYATDLLPRRAPFPFVLKFYFIKLCKRFFGDKNGRDSHPIMKGIELAFDDDPAITPRKQWQGDDGPGDTR